MLPNNAVPVEYDVEVRLEYYNLEKVDLEREDGDPRMFQNSDGSAPVILHHILPFGGKQKVFSEAMHSEECARHRILAE